MAQLHRLVVAASGTTNLIELATYLQEACQIVLSEGEFPHLNFAVRFICYQIAFAGDGDMPSGTYYKNVLDFCVENVDNDKSEGEIPSEPTRTSS